MSHHQLPDPHENRRFILAFILSLLVLGGYYLFYQHPRQLAQRAQIVAAEQAAATAQSNAKIDVPVPPKTCQ